MKDERLDVTRGSGNVFRDLGHENADIAQCKAILAAEIIKALDRDGLSVRAARMVWPGRPRTPVQRSRLWARQAMTVQAALAVNLPDGKCARA